jgi:hypothetical protein
VNDRSQERDKRAQIRFDERKFRSGEGKMIEITKQLFTGNACTGIPVSATEIVPAQKLHDHGQAEFTQYFKFPVDLVFNSGSSAPVSLAEMEHSRHNHFVPASRGPPRV